jgi:hypothetical protein
MTQSFLMKFLKSTQIHTHGGVGSRAEALGAARAQGCSFAVDVIGCSIEDTCNTSGHETSIDQF